MKSIILTVDDNPIILDIYQSILNDQYALHLADSGEEALAVLQSGLRPDLILLDIMMSGMNGYEVCQKIRSHDLLSHLKIILVSAKSTVEERLLGYTVGADDYITKPFEDSELLAKINSFLRLKNVEEFYRIKKDLIGLISHEMRTPLNGIIGFSQLLQQSTNISEEEKEYVETIRKCGYDLLKLSDKAILLNDLRSGGIKLNKSIIKLNELLSHCEAVLLDDLNRKRLSLETCGDIHAEMAGDPGLILHAFQVVLDNAVKYAFEGTRIGVSYHGVGNRLQIDICNEGGKISNENLENIFDVFFVQNIDHHHRGHGLSLATARLIVEAHDGRLSVENHDKGPVFKFEFQTETETLKY